jgi:ADP-ribose pyrophosphatase
VLVKQFRVPINDYVYELPAGLIDGQEPVFEAAARELREETGLRVVSIDEERNPFPVYVSCGMTDESIALVYCTCEGQVSEKYLEEDEDLEVVLVSREEARELINRKAKFDIKAYLVLQRFAESGF